MNGKVEESVMGKRDGITACALEVERALLKTALLINVCELQPMARRHRFHTTDRELCSHSMFMHLTICHLLGQNPPTEPEIASLNPSAESR